MIPSTTTFHTEFLFIGPKFEKFIRKGVIKKLGKIIKYHENCILLFTIFINIFLGAHPLSHATSIAWLDNNTMISCGHDGNIKQWNIMYE